MSLNHVPLTDPSRFLDEEKPLAFPLYCAEVWDFLGLPNKCCSSCHDDWDMGYDGPSEYDWFNEETGEYEIWATACCSLSNALDKAGITR